MSLGQVVLVLMAGTAAGAVNAVVGGGGLLTFPVLLAVGLPPVTANVTSTVGVLAGSLSSAWSYRPELAGHWVSLRAPMAVVAGSSALGALLLLGLPASSFASVVPALMALACVLTLCQPLLARALAKAGPAPRRLRVLLLGGLVAAGVYGGYFGVGVGVLLMALLTLLFSQSMQVASAAKNVLAAVTNGVAGALFVFGASINWTLAIVLSVGTVIGGRLGVGVGRRLQPTPYRLAIVAVGLIATFRVAATS